MRHAHLAQHDGLREILGSEQAQQAIVVHRPLNLARYTEPACMLLVQLAYARAFGARIGLALVRETAASQSRVS